MKKMLLCLTLLVGIVFNGRAAIWYVRAGMSGTGAGSWANASGDLQDVINNAIAGDSIFIAAGTYIPNRRADATGTITPGDRANAFVLKDNIYIFGGFPSVGDPVFTDRNITANPTILSADFNGDDIVTGSGIDLALTGNSENACRVLISINNSIVYLDGFTIKGANATVNTIITVGGISINQQYGGGVHCNLSSLFIRNCRWINNTAVYGSGIYSGNNSTLTIDSSEFSDNFTPNSGSAIFHDNNSSSVITHCRFSGNSSPGYAGSIYNIDGSHSVSNCLFLNNHGLVGAAIFNEPAAIVTIKNSYFAGQQSGPLGAALFNNGATTLINCSFTNNSSVGGASAITSRGGSVVISGATFAGNSELNSVMNIAAGTATMDNSILWRNNQISIYNIRGTVTVSNSIVDGGYAGTGNLDTDPLFKNIYDPAGPDNTYGTADDGFALLYCSPAINAGNNSSIPAGTITDITFQPRIFNSTVDLGAYEDQGTLPIVVPPVLYVDSASIASGAGDSWGTAFKTLQEALDLLNDCNHQTQIWVKKGTYYPTAYPPTNKNVRSSRDYTFRMRSNLSIYGGFPATPNPVFTDRNSRANPTILSGDYNNDDVVSGSGSTLSITGNGENAHHILLFIDNDSTRIDGLTIRGGNADTNLIVYVAGRKISSAVGGGLYSYYSSPVVNNCVFLNNNTSAQGAGMLSLISTPTITNCVFSCNSAVEGGGGLSNSVSDPMLTNCIFSGNYGGAVINTATRQMVTNCSFWGNHATHGGVFFNNYSSTTVRNSIIWGNTDHFFSPDTSVVSVSHSLIQGGHDGPGNLAIDPLFADTTNTAGADGLFGTADDGLFLQSASPAINAGKDSLVPAGIITDINGNARVQGIVDMGAYEQNRTVPLPVKLLSFSAMLSGNDVVTRWTTTEESGAGHFEVHYGTDGRQFSKAGQVAANNNNNLENRYNFIHHDAATLQANTLYYRLKQVDLNGDFVYSNIVAVRLPEASGVTLIYPNPIAKGTMLTITGRDIAQVALFNVYGQQVWLRKYDKQLTVQVPTQQLVAGTYLIQVNGAATRKLHVQPD